MTPAVRRAAAALALVAAALVCRGPLHAATFALPVSNDDAILLLMGRRVLAGELSTTLWNQPYNGALDAYLLAPLLAVLPHHAAYRLYQAACAALLVLLAGLLGRRLGGPAAGFAAALLAACGTPYMALMGATGPPPNFLMPLVTGGPLLAALAARRLGGAASLGLGLVCGPPCGTRRWPCRCSPGWPRARRRGLPAAAGGGRALRRGSAPRRRAARGWRGRSAPPARRW
ncbi:MAG: hypothetical protein U0599_13785 [Vicinamibacteria bacterium]